MQRVLDAPRILRRSPFALICLHSPAERHSLLLFVGAIKLRRSEVYSDFWAIRLRVERMGANKK